MDDGTELYRRYRRLARAYPPGRRRDELLDTMVEAAAAGGRRGPTARERINIFGYGLRTRLRQPRTVWVLIFAVLLTAAGAYVGAAVGNRIGLGLTAESPSGAADRQLSATVFPGLKVWGGRPAHVIESQPDGEGIEFGWTEYWVRHTDATRDVAAYAAGARGRLTAAGWAVHDYGAGDGEQGGDGAFWASRPGLVLRFDDYVITDGPYYDSDGGAQYSVRHDGSVPRSFDRAGAALGGLLTLLLTVWVARRTRFSGPGNALVGLAAGVILVLLIPGTLFSTPPDPPGREPWWSGFESELGLGPTVFAGFLAAILLLVAFFHRAGRPRRALGAAASFVGRNRRPVTAALLVLVAGLATVGVLHRLGVTQPVCRPAASVPVAPPESAVRGSDRVHVYVDPAATPDQRNLIVAAMRRSWALGEEAELIWRPDSPEFRAQYCGGGRIPAAAVAGLPYFFSVRLDYAPDFPAFLDEVQDQAGVLAVQRVPS